MTTFTPNEIPALLPAESYTVTRNENGTFTLIPSHTNPLIKRWCGDVLRKWATCFEFTFQGRFTIARHRYLGNLGVSLCGPADIYNSDIGKAIAIARALNLEIPDDI